MVTICFIGAFGGKFLQRYVPLEKIRMLGGVIFAIFGIVTLASLAIAVG
jgi:putative Ca2+/H+ antiporter (TMEM165/GDT1 family)